jgi:hypothetical protein
VVDYNSSEYMVKVNYWEGYADRWLNEVKGKKNEKGIAGAI